MRSDQETFPARYVHLGAAMVRVGSLAGNNAVHPFAPDTGTGTLCLACYGWSNDPRHVFHRALFVRTVVTRDA